MSISYIVLASSSRQKYRLLRDFAKEKGLKLLSLSQKVKERVFKSPKKTALYNAKQKLFEGLKLLKKKHKEKFSKSLVVSSDVFAYSKKHSYLFKPKNKEEALSTLLSISCKELEVYNATALAFRDFYSISFNKVKIKIKCYTKEQAKREIEKLKLWKRAGSFSFSNVEVIEGSSPCLIMGLDMQFVENIYNLLSKEKEKI